MTLALADSQQTSRHFQGMFGCLIRGQEYQQHDYAHAIKCVEHLPFHSVCSDTAKLPTSDMARKIDTPLALAFASSR